MKSKKNTKKAGEMDQWVKVHIKSDDLSLNSGAYKVKELIPMCCLLQMWTMPHECTREPTYTNE